MRNDVFIPMFIASSEQTDTIMNGNLMINAFMDEGRLIVRPAYRRGEIKV